MCDFIHCPHFNVKGSILYARRDIKACGYPIMTMRLTPTEDERKFFWIRQIQGCVGDFRVLRDYGAGNRGALCINRTEDAPILANCYLAINADCTRVAGDNIYIADVIPKWDIPAGDPIYV